MTKAKFSEQQPKVTIVTKGDKDFFFLCLNEELTSEQYEDKDYPYYQYDYNEIVEDAGKIDHDDITEHPEKYLYHTQETEKTLEEQVAELKESNEMLTQCIIEMSELVYQ